jgi:uncharacterized protein
MLARASAGLGLRRALMGPLREAVPGAFDFLEVAPENWIGVGGRLGGSSPNWPRATRWSATACRCRSAGPTRSTSPSCTGCAASSTTTVALYSEHLSYCSDGGHLYDLMPIPFTERSGAPRRRAHPPACRTSLGRRIAVENISYYAAPHQAMDEIDFINAVLSEADCDLLLDVNNIHVNSINHGYDALPSCARCRRRAWPSIHVAGHYNEAADLIVDTHGAAGHRPGLGLLDAAYAHCGVRPTLLERDFNFPPMAELLGEVGRSAPAVAGRHDEVRHAAA